MGLSATVSAMKTPAGSVLAAASGAVMETLHSAEWERMESIISTELPTELQPSARELLRAVLTKVAVAEHFDAFCGQAFSKPDWAAAASPVIAEIFEQDEDQLAELARIPDLVIEMGAGQVSVTCMVASRWAARGETHRLSRLADAMVASHASKSACAVDVMLALAATLAVTRFSRAEQLLNAALPLAGEEHQEAISDAKHWLAAGRIVCSSPQEERDFWDVRLRTPKTAWSWHNKQEKQALEALLERLSTDQEGADLYKAVLPPFWWDLAMKWVQQQESLALAAKKAAESVPIEPPTPYIQPDAPQEVSRGERIPPIRASAFSRFVLGWVCGAMAMAITVLVLPPEVVERVLHTLRFTGTNSEPADTLSPVVLNPLPKTPKTPVEKEAWRKDNLQKMASEMASFASQHASAKTGKWKDNEMVLSGHSQELPYDSPEYMKLLVWLHLDPPEDSEVRSRVSKLLIERVKTGAISLWEELLYPGSVNAEEIKCAAREALEGQTAQWSAEDKDRLRSIAGLSDEPKTKNLSVQQ